MESPAWNLHAQVSEQQTRRCWRKLCIENTLTPNSYPIRVSRNCKAGFPVLCPSGTFKPQARTETCQRLPRKTSTKLNTNTAVPSVPRYWLTRLILAVGMPLLSSPCRWTRRCQTLAACPKTRHPHERMRSGANEPSCKSMISHTNLVHEPMWVLISACSPL